MWHQKIINVGLGIIFDRDDLLCPIVALAQIGDDKALTS